MNSGNSNKRGGKFKVEDNYTKPAFITQFEELLHAPKPVHFKTKEQAEDLSFSRSDTEEDQPTVVDIKDSTYNSTKDNLNKMHKFTMKKEHSNKPISSSKSIALSYEDSSE